MSKQSSSTWNKDPQRQNNIFDTNVDFFGEMDIIDKEEIAVIGDVNKNHDKFCVVIKNFFDKLVSGIEFVLVDGYIGKIDNGIVSYTKTSLPLLYLFGGMAYRTISDFYAPKGQGIENYSPLSGDYDIIAGVNGKIFYLGADPFLSINKDGYTKITNLQRFLVFKGNDVFVEDNYTDLRLIPNKFKCDKEICDDVYVKNDIYNHLKETFLILLKELANILVKMGINLSKPTENIIDTEFIKFVEYSEKNINLAVYVAGFSSMTDYVDAHFRIGFPVGKHMYHILEMQIHEGYPDRNIIDRYVIKDTLEKNKKIVIYDLITGQYQIPIISPKNLLITQTKALYDRSKKAKYINIQKCRKDYMRIKYLCTLLYNYNEMLPIDDAQDFLNECNTSYNQLLKFKEIVSSCAAPKNIPIYGALENIKSDQPFWKQSQNLQKNTTKTLYSSPSNFSIDDVLKIDVMSWRRKTNELNNAKLNDLESYYLQHQQLASNPKKSQYTPTIARKDNVTYSAPPDGDKESNKYIPPNVSTKYIPPKRSVTYTPSAAYASSVQSNKYIPPKKSVQYTSERYNKYDNQSNKYNDQYNNLLETSDQFAGNNNDNDVVVHHKYLKYKQKYLQLKNDMQY